MRYLCTYFDSGYLSRALVLQESLEKYAAPFKLWALCFDKESFDALAALKLNGVVPVRLEDFEDDELRAVKSSRSKVEYYFTCTPSLVLYVLKNNPGIDVIHYVDADLVFFSSPEAMEQDFGNNSIYIIGHRYSRKAAIFERSGIYNVGLVGFRNDVNGMECLTWWRAKCIDWCYDYLDGDRFADQKYLNSWPSLFKGVRVAAHMGVGVAPWNLEGSTISDRDGVLFSGNQPIVFFHYHGFRRLCRHLYDPNIGPYGVSMNQTVRKRIFEAYALALLQAERRVADVGTTASLASGSKMRRKKNQTFAQKVAGRLSGMSWFVRNLVMGRLVWCKGV